VAAPANSQQIAQQWSSANPNTSIGMSYGQYQGPEELRSYFEQGVPSPAPTPTQAQPPSGAALTGQPQYSNDVINNVLRQRFLESGPLSAEDVNRAAIRYGISPQQVASIDPRLMEQIQTAGLAPARETLADVSQGLRGDYATAQQFQAPYREYGQEAAQRQAALTGALGPEAQQQAFAEYQASPALGFLQEQSERALMRNAAAMGGLGGGNVRQDLTKLTADLYSRVWRCCNVCRAWSKLSHRSR